MFERQAKIVLWRQHLQPMMLGRLDFCVQNDHTRPVPCPSYKNQLIVDHRSKPKAWTHQISRGKRGGLVQDISTSKDFLDKNPKTQASREKFDYIKLRRLCTAMLDLHRVKTLLTEW